MRRRVVLLVVGLTVAAAGCGDDSGMVFKDPRGTIHAETGQRFTLEFSVNSSVGYDWEPEPHTQPEDVELEKTSVDYPNEESIGSSGFKRFTYEVLDSGRFTLVLRRVYRGDPQETRRIEVVVAD